MQQPREREMLNELFRSSLKETAISIKDYVNGGTNIAMTSTGN